MLNFPLPQSHLVLPHFTFTLQPSLITITFLPDRRVDKYGRKVSSRQDKNDVKRFYRLQDEKLNEDSSSKLIDYARGEVLLESSDEEEEEGEADNAQKDESDEDERDVVLGQHASKPIPILGDDEYLEVDLNEDEDAYADLDAQAASYANEHLLAPAVDEEEEVGTKTNRLAVVNLDWDHVRASHLYKIFSSLVSPSAPALPASSEGLKTETGKTKGSKGQSKGAAPIARGRVLSVCVYRSEFGKERLKKEDVEGPPKEIFKRNIHNEDESTYLTQEDDGTEYNEKALRKYQLERLRCGGRAYTFMIHHLILINCRYYYAIATCDTVDAASHLLSELDGTELERSANVFDLSFVPDSMTFTPDDLRDEATATSEDARSRSDFKGLDFSTDALRHSKVTLKWDEDDPERNKMTRRALSKKDIEEGNFKALVASSESEDEDEGVGGREESKKIAERDRLRSLLLGGSGAKDSLPEGWGDPGFDSDGDGDADMEITFMPGLSEAANKKGDETTIEKYKRKQKEKREARKARGKTNEDGDKEKSGKKKTKKIDDDFFDAGSSSDGEEGAELEEPHQERRPATAEELALLLAPDNVDGVVAALEEDEKPKSKKKGRKGRKGRKGKVDEEGADGFIVDATDERFKAVHEDHMFSIDPSNPQYACQSFKGSISLTSFIFSFKKTKGMEALLSERSKRQQKSDHEAERTVGPKDGEKMQQSLQSLVESVKRKSKHGDKGTGKRRKV